MTCDIRSPNTVPWPQPVVTTRVAVFDAKASMPERVFTAALCTSQSTVIDSISESAADQPLVAQVAQHQQFGRGAQRHQRDQLALVDEDGQRSLDRDVDAAVLAVLVEHLDLARQRQACVRQTQANRP